jgi:hypothetical protein
MNALLGRRTAAAQSEEFFVRQLVEPWRRTKRIARSRILPATLVAVSALVLALPTASASSKGPSALYGPFSHGLPTSPDFFPISVWYQSPSGGNVPAPYTDQAQAFKAMGINVFVGVSQSNGLDWPESYGADQGEMAAAAAAGIYVIGGGDPSCSPANTGSDPCDTDHASVESVQKLLASLPASDAKYFAGYQWTDEPACNVDISLQASTIHNEDPTRMTYANEGAWTADLPNNDIGAPSGSGLTSTQCLSKAETNLVAPSIVSSDDYALTDPWHSSVCAGANCVYLYGDSAATMRRLAGPTQPVWSFIETGTDDLGLSSQNGPCNFTTNTCAHGNEAAATPAQVNSAAWDAVINGANGIEWFCDDSVAYDACAGGGPDGQPAVSGSRTYGIAANLSSIDHTIENFAPELNSPDAPGLTVSSGLPMSTMLKDVDGKYYLFAESDRDGTTTSTFRDPALAGDTATLVYNSAAEYGPDVHDAPSHHVTTAGAFSANFGPQYQVKVYEIS